MDEVDFRGVLEEFLVPMFSGSSLGNTRASTINHRLVAYSDPCVLLLKPSATSAFRVELHRSQPFTPQEKQLVAFFIDELVDIVANTSQRYYADLMDLVPRRVIARLLLVGTRPRRTLEEAIERFELLASATYEGQPVVAGLGVTGSKGHGSITLDELWAEDFAPALSNGLDSAYVCGGDGRVFNLEILRDAVGVRNAPLRFGPIAAWTTGPNRAALALNRAREILVFKGKTLQFAKRRGSWRYYTHDSVVGILGVGSKPLRQGVYESCIDVSFGRTGGCIAIVRGKDLAKLMKMLPTGELIASQEQTRTRLLYAAVRRPFHSLDRRLRQELLSMDGATILSHSGEVITAGTIVRVPSGSAGGGRRAAAVQLSEFGLGIKISADGPITGFRSGEEFFRVY